MKNQHRRLNIDLLFRVPTVASYHLARDGKTLAFAWNKTGQHEIYLLNTQRANPERVTFPPESKFVPRFSPTGQELTYTMDHQGDELNDIYLLDLKTRKSNNITPNTPESISSDITWSPDGKQLAFSSNQSGKFSIYSLPRSGGQPKLLHKHQYLDYDPKWSPDGKKIAFTSLVKGQDQGIFITTLETRETAQLSEKGRAIESSEPAWSPDSKTIAFTSAEKGMYDIGLYQLDSQTVQWLTDGEYESSSPIWAPKGDKLAYEVNRDANIQIALHTIGNGTEVVQAAPGLHTNIRFSPNGDEMYFLYTGPRNPTDLWKYSFKAGHVAQVTKSLPDQLYTSGFISPAPVNYKSSDGRSIPALLYRPRRGRGQRPAIVYIHGGPTAQFTNTWTPLVQEYLDRGYIVIAPNYRGSTGYGREFREANRFAMGKLDLDDVVKSVEYLVGTGLVDPRRIAVTGGSFGGYLTMCALTKYPDLWAAGSALVPFLNWFTEIANERDDLQYWDKQNMGDPEKDKERLREASPIFYIDQVKAPVQLIAGAHDPRCPASETLQARDELQRLGKKAEVVIYEDEGHGFLKLDNRVDAYKKNLQFLTIHLGK